MENLVELNRQRFFSLDEARDLLPIVQRITRQHSERVESLISRIESLSTKQNEITERLEAEINSEVQSWQSKLEKLGVHPKGLWVADFDSGDGYFCWKFPEPTIAFWHRYSDGFSGRIPVENYLNPTHSSARARTQETTV
jgi:hypothetical protein